MSRYKIQTISLDDLIVTIHSSTEDLVLYVALPSSSYRSASVLSHSALSPALHHREDLVVGTLPQPIMCCRRETNTRCLLSDNQ